MTQIRNYSSAAQPTTLSSAITSTAATTCSVGAVTGWPTVYPFTALIDWGSFVSGSVQEAVSVTNVSGGGPFTLTIARGIDGTGGQTHLSGAAVVHGFTPQDLEGLDFQVFQLGIR